MLFKKNLKKIGRITGKIGLGCFLLSMLGVACELIFALIVIIASFLIDHYFMDQLIAMGSFAEVYRDDMLILRGWYNNDHGIQDIRITITREGDWVVHDEMIAAYEGRKILYQSTPWQASALGRYTARAEFVEEVDGRWIGRHAVTEEFSVVEDQGLPFILTTWCGEHTKGYPGVILNPDFSHPVAVEILDRATGQPPQQHNIPVTFTVYEYPSWIQVGTPIYTNSHLRSMGNENHVIAHAHVTLSTQEPEPDQYLHHVVVVSCDQARNSVELNIYGINDIENSHLAKREDDTHQKGDQYGSEIEVPGDNYNDDGEPGDYKDIVIELDYYLWLGSNLDITEIQTKMANILETAGIRVTFIGGNEIEEGTQVGQMSEYTDRQKRMELLYYHKLRDSNLDRIWNNYIHIILGSKYNGTHLGTVEMYPQSGEIFYKWKSWHMGSAIQSVSAPYLDSVGCFVYAWKVATFPGLEMEVNHAIALIAAHEVGHALGMWHHYDSPNNHHVMVVDLGVALTDLFGLVKWGKFDPTTLDGGGDVAGYLNDGMNTRNKLCVDCVNSIHEGKYY